MSADNSQAKTSKMMIIMMITINVYELKVCEGYSDNR